MKAILLLAITMFGIQAMAAPSCWTEDQNEHTQIVDGSYLVMMPMDSDEEAQDSFKRQLAEVIEIDSLIEDLYIVVGQAEQRKLESHEEMKARVVAGITQLEEDYPGTITTCNALAQPFPGISARN